MPKLSQFKLEIKTGTNRGPEHPSFSINGFPLEFEETEGSTDAGATFTAVGSPNSFPHALVLMGPEQGEVDWDIESVTARYECDGMESYERSEEHTSELQSRRNLVCRLLLEKKKKVSRRINDATR